MSKRRERRVRKKTSEPKTAAAPRSKSKRKGFDKIYHDYYKQLLLIPFAMLLAAIIILSVSYAQTGQFIKTGVSLSGGLTVTVPTIDSPLNVEALESRLQSEFPNDLLAREIAEFGVQQAITIQVAPLSDDEDLEALEQRLVSSLQADMPHVRDSYTVEIIGPSLGRSFLRQTLTALVVAFIFMALVVFYYFRTFIPSMAVVLAALSDMIVTLAVVSVMDMRLSSAGIAAFLMLIGYSVDTDILLSTRVLKRKEGLVYDRIKSAISTGLLMNITTLVALTTALVITQSEVIAQIMTILLIGLIVDIINTWIQNAGILRWYAEGKE